MILDADRVRQLAGLKLVSDHKLFNSAVLLAREIEVLREMEITARHRMDIWTEETYTNLKNSLAKYQALKEE